MITKKAFFALKDQSGAALVIALIMIIVLTLIALASSYTSIFEIMLSGNKRSTTDAFYTADGGVQAVLPVFSNFSTSSYTLIPNSSTLPQALQNESIDMGFSSPIPSYPPGFVGFTNPSPTVTIYHTTRVGAPRGLGFSASGDYNFAYYIIDSTGRDQIDAGLKSNCEVIEKVVVLVPTLQGGN
jgi:hypothetical protein